MNDAAKDSPRPVAWAPVVIAVFVGAVLGGGGARLLFGSGDEPAVDFLPDSEMFQAAGQAVGVQMAGDAGSAQPPAGVSPPGGGSQVVEGRVAQVVPGGQSPSGGDSNAGEESDQSVEPVGEQEPEQEQEQEEEEDGDDEPAALGAQAAVDGQGAGGSSPGTDPALPGAGALAGSGGCHQQCIVKALAIPTITSPDLQLEVRTTVPATVAVYVNEEKNQIGEPIARADDPLEQWSATLEPLDWDKLYHIRVRAEDENGGVAWRVGTVRTLQPPKNQTNGGLANVGGGAGCSVPCITSALLVPLEGTPDMELRVRTKTPARLESWVLDEELGPPLTAEAPYSSGEELLTEWTARLDFNYSTTYRAWLRAVDENSYSQLAETTFTTETPTLIVDFHRIHIDFDGDDGVGGDGGRGEISFKFAVGDATERKAGVAEAKISDGETVHLEDGNRSPGITVTQPAGPFVPVIRAQAWERDSGSALDTCRFQHGALSLANTDRRSIDGCDFWINTAVVGEINRVLEPADLYDPCPAHGLTGDYQNSRCRWISTTEGGSQSPTFSALISLHVLE